MGHLAQVLRPTSKVGAGSLALGAGHPVGLRSSGPRTQMFPQVKKAEQCTQILTHMETMAAHLLPSQRKENERNNDNKNLDE